MTVSSTQTVSDQQAELRREFRWRCEIESPTTDVAAAFEGLLGVVQADDVLPPPRGLPEITMSYVDPHCLDTGVAAHLLSAGVDWIASRGHRHEGFVSSKSIGEQDASMKVKNGYPIRSWNRYRRSWPRSSTTDDGLTAATPKRARVAVRSD